jgi:hypothetical protein
MYVCIYIYTHYNQLSPFIYSLITVRFAMSIAAMVTCSALASPGISPGMGTVGGTGDGGERSWREKEEEGGEIQNDCESQWLTEMCILTC